MAGRVQWAPRRVPGGGAGAGPQGQSAKPFEGSPIFLGLLGSRKKSCPLL